MDDPLVTVHNANWLHDALFVKSVLEGDGIEAFVPDQHTVGVDPLYATALGGIRVVVRAADEERARAVLTAVLRDVENPEE
jgi:hypothetical protein